jgi:hypothetical protein
MVISFMWACDFVMDWWVSIMHMKCW